MKIRTLLLAVLLIACSVGSFAQPSAAEDDVWKLEGNYWNYVQKFNLESYKNLWHKDFLGWPYVSPEPVSKDHITDWIEAYRAKGLHLDHFTLRHAGSRANGNIVVAYYWIDAFWADKDGHGETASSRITHTWIKDGNGWRILGGMSAAISKEK